MKHLANCSGLQAATDIFYVIKNCYLKNLANLASINYDKYIFNSCSA